MMWYQFPIRGRTEKQLGTWVPARMGWPPFYWRPRNLCTIVYAISVTAIVAAIIPQDAAAQACNSRHGSAVIICGTNGGTSSQIFSPGSVIIMRQERLAFPSELPDSALPHDAAAAQHAMALLSNRSTPDERVTWAVTGFGLSREQSSSEAERGYSSDRQGVIGEMRIERPAYTLFFGLDASDENQDYAPDSVPSTGGRRPLPVPPASVTREDVGISLGGSIELRPGLVWHMAGRVGRIEMDTRRSSYDLRSTGGFLDPASNIKRTFIGRGSTEGTAIAAQTGVSYDRPLGSGFHGGVSGSLFYVRESFDGFTERLDEPLVDFSGNETTSGFRFGNDQRKSLVSRLGVEVVRPVRIGDTMIVPSLSIAWLHEFADDSRTIDVHAPAGFTGSLGAPQDFHIATNDPDRDYFTLGASLGMRFGDGRGSLAVDYDAILGHDFIDEHLISLRVGYRF